jgi:hypothetical protein
MTESCAIQQIISDFTIVRITAHALQGIMVPIRITAVERLVDSSDLRKYGI